MSELLAELRRRREPSERLRELSLAVNLERAPLRVSSGLEELDRLCGGWPRGALSELLAARGGGGGVLYASLRAAGLRSEACALIDPFRALDPRSALDAGVPLESLLWVCPPDERRAARAAELLLESGGFALVALDLRAAPRGPEPLPTSVWLRLARRARQRGAVCLTLVSWPRVHSPALALQVDGSPRWAGVLREVCLRLRLHRGGRHD